MASWWTRSWFPGSQGCNHVFLVRYETFVLSLVHLHVAELYSTGPFGCLGKTLAVQEMRVVTAKALLTYDLKLAPDFDNDAFVHGIQNMRTTIFKYPINVVATPRH